MTTCSLSNDGDDFLTLAEKDRQKTEALISQFARANRDRVDPATPISPMMAVRPLPSIAKYNPAGASRPSEISAGWAPDDSVRV